MAASFESVMQELKRGEVHPVYYLTGEEDTLKDELIGALASAVLEPGSRDFNLDVRQASDLDAEEFHTLVETLPVLAERRVVAVKAIEQWRKNSKVWEVLYRYVDRPSKSTVLILTQGPGNTPDPRLARASVQVELDRLSGEGLLSWVERNAASAGVKLTPRAMEHLVAAVGSDLAHLRMELHKLAAAFGSDQPVDQDGVARLVGVRRGETLGDWTTAVIERSISKALELVDVVLPQGGVTAVGMVTALGQELLGVRLARSLLDRGIPESRLAGVILEELRAARPKGLRDWRAAAALWSRAARLWTAEELDEAIPAAYEADRALKTTRVSDERAVLNNLLLAIGALRREVDAA